MPDEWYTEMNQSLCPICEPGGGESDTQSGLISHSVTNAMLRSQNEEEVGQGIKESGVPREEIFLTSKLCVTMLYFFSSSSSG